MLHRQAMAKTLGTHHFIDISNFYNNINKGIFLLFYFILFILDSKNT